MSNQLAHVDRHLVREGIRTLQLVAGAREERLSLGRLVRGLCDGSFRSVRSRELDAVRAHEERVGEVEGMAEHSAKVPREFFSTRALISTTSTLGGYLTDTPNGDYIPLLIPWNPTILSSATVYRAPPSSGTNYPVGGTQVTSTWLTPESGGSIAEQTQAFGQVASSPKQLTSFLNASRLLLLQSDADQVLADELMRSASTTLVEAIVQGLGYNGQPAGLLNQSGLSTVAGTSLAYGGIVTAQSTVANANGVVDPTALGWITTPSVAALLKQRYISSANVEPIWRGGMPLGELDRVPAEASKVMPSGTALFGDWSQIAIVEYPSGVLLEVDPYSNFKSLEYGLRVTVYVDVIAKHLASFYGFTSIT